MITKDRPKCVLVIKNHTYWYMILDFFSNKIFTKIWIDRKLVHYKMPWNTMFCAFICRWMKIHINMKMIMKMELQIRRLNMSVLVIDMKKKLKILSRLAFKSKHHVHVRPLLSTLFSQENFIHTCKNNRVVSIRYKSVSRGALFFFF